DLLIWNHAHDIMDGGADTDTLDFSASPSAVWVNLAYGQAWTADLPTLPVPGAWHQIGTLTNMENLVGSEFSDMLTGYVGANNIEGRGGDDILNGSFGNDILDGGAGNDILDGGPDGAPLLGGPGNDLLIWNHAHDIMDGGADTD